MCPHLHHERDQLIKSCLFTPFSNNKIHFLFCNTSKPTVLFMYSPPICSPICFVFFFQKNVKNKAIRKHKLSLHSTNNLKPKKPRGQSSIKTFYEGLPGKKSKLNMITSTVADKYAVVRSFGFRLILGRSEKSTVITKSFESYSELVSSNLEMKVLKKKFLLMN